MISYEDYQGKVVLVTGAGRGLGRTLVRAFALQGARVAANDLTPVNLDETLRRVRAELPAVRQGDVQDFLADVSQKMAVQGMFNGILDRWGRVDVVINNAAVRPRIALLDMDEWDWRRVLDVNLTGVFFVTQIAGRIMRAQGGGVILNIGQAGGGFPGSPPVAAYLASKAGLDALTRQAAAELRPFGVRVNAVAPGLLDGETLREWVPAEAQRQALVDAGLLVAPDAAAGPVLYLCSQAAEGISGQVWRVGAGSFRESGHMGRDA